MKHGNSSNKRGITIGGIIIVLLLLVRAYTPHAPNTVAADSPQPSIAGQMQDPAPEPDRVQFVPDASDQDKNRLTSWINNDGRFTGQTTRLLSWVESGQPLDIRIDGQAFRRYGFRETRVTAENFQISTGSSAVLPSEYRIYSGRELTTNGLGEGASMALVNGAFSMTISRDGTDYLIETDAVTGELYAVALQSFDNVHSCTSGGCDAHHTTCEISADGIASISAPEGAGLYPLERIPVDVVYPGDRLDVASTIEPAGEPGFEAGTGGKPYLRNGAEYDASLKDILVLMVSAKSQTGASSGLSAKAASYFAITARAADVYERQLGLRYMLQELVLIPSDSSEDDPGTVGSTLGDDLYHLQSWVNANRPQSTYKWGHVALWTYVDGGAGGVIGLAWTDSYGSASYGHSTQELSWGWGVHIHELGHNVGSSHSSGGVMNPSIISGNEDFFTYVSGQSYTSARDIYNYMANRSYVFGPAPLRHPEEIPFGVDDTLATPAGTALTFNAIANDKASVPNGATNTLRLVEIGQVYPRAAGTASLVDGQIEFTPANGFTGQAWFSYTVGGDVGNSGSGWLHRADIVITVGGDSSAPSSTPAISLQNDYISEQLTGPVRINPLLNDEGSGRMWSGDVEVVLSPNDTTPEAYSYKSFWLADARIVAGTGSLTLETHNMTRGSSGGRPVNTGYILYTPGPNETGDVVIEYTVMDASGATATAQIIMADMPSVGVSADYLTTAEDSGDIITFTFSRSASADTSVDESINFSVAGTTTPSGAKPDYALAGHSSFDPVTAQGTVLIPAGRLDTTVLMAIEDDGIDEGQETMILSISSSSSLQVSSAGSTTTIWINDNSLVYYESFDAFTTDSSTWSGWTNLKNKNPSGKGGEDFFDWQIGSGATATPGTGPSSDHTSGSGKYFFAESGNHLSSYAILESPVISTSGVGAGNLEFWYHMLGSDMGSLGVELYVDGRLASANFFSATGQQSSGGTDWKKASLNLDPYLPAQSIQLRFRADIGSGDLSDIAIDDLRIAAQSSSLPQPPNILVDPAGCIVEQGQSVYLSVISHGFPAPQVQWYRNGIEVPGATSAALYIPAMDETTAGIYEAAVSNTEGTVLSYPAELAFSGPPSDNFAYNFWAQIEQGLSASSWGETDDSDGDGILNVLEFAFNMDPSLPSTAGMPVFDYVQDPNGDVFLSITYQRPADWEAKGIIYLVESSGTLVPGSWVPAVTNDTVQTNGSVQTVTATSITAVGSGPSFMRINVDLAATDNPPPLP